MKLRLREHSSSPVLGRNMHCLNGHPRLTFVMENYRPGKALDVASGRGAFALWLHQQGCRTTMLDILPAMPPADGILAIQMDLHDLEGYIERFNVVRYDTVLFMEAVEHMQDPERAVEICYRITAPGGVLLMTTPWVPSWDDELDHVWRFDQAGVEELLAPYEARVWSDRTFVYAVVEKEEVHEPAG